ncbi:MAG: HesA/MoeB/ThiF family protein, partial [Candidatus Bathyarchaeia archaeon]
RYNRQMLLNGWGEEGQLRLKNAKVTIAGTGGLGCPAAIYLAAAGVGCLQLLDNDQFELSNLNRQILGWESDIGRPKTVAVREKLLALNSDIEVEARQVEITSNNICDLIRDSNVVVDAMDNWKTRFIINKGCVESRVPLVHAGIHGMSGQITTIIPGKGPCLSCILPREPPEIRPFPVVGATPGLLAMLQVMETIKLIVGIGKPLVGKLLIFSGEDMSFSTVEVLRNPQCPVCTGIRDPSNPDI